MGFDDIDKKHRTGPVPKDAFERIERNHTGNIRGQDTENICEEDVVGEVCASSIPSGTLSGKFNEAVNPIKPFQPIPVLRHPMEEAKDTTYLKPFSRRAALD